MYRLHHGIGDPCLVVLHPTYLIIFSMFTQLSLASLLLLFLLSFALFLSFFDYILWMGVMTVILGHADLVLILFLYFLLI